MARGSTYTQSYSDFVGVDLSSDPKAVSHRRLAYSVNMWKDYESEQGAAVESFPGFRRLVNGLGAIHGLYHFRAKDGEEEYLIVHAGTRLYAFDSKVVADYDDKELSESDALSGVSLADSDSEGYICNNNLYILDGQHFVTVRGVGDENGAISVTADEMDAYIPTTYFDGKPYEQRNMLIDEAWEKTTAENVGELHIDIKDDVYPEGYIYGGKPVSDFIDQRQIDNGYLNDGVTGFSKKKKSPYIYVNSISARSDDTYYPLWFGKKSFENEHIVRMVDAATNCYSVVFDELSFAGCENLTDITLYITQGITLDDGTTFGNLTVYPRAFEGCRNLKSINIYHVGIDKIYISTNITQLGGELLGSGISNGDFNIPEGVNINIEASPLTERELNLKYNHLNRYRFVSPWEIALATNEVRRTYDDKSVDFGYELEERTENGKTYEIVKKVYIGGRDIEYRPEDGDETSPPLVSDVKVLYELDPVHFSTVENVKNFYDGNPDYRKTGVEAINGCTKSAVFDGRVFLTGNPELPNTVFYSHRNLTGANDPTYFGVYNYFNDGDGNTPNVDLLSTPSMLMVLKNDTVQDGSVYYHVGAYNTDEYSKDLVPRIYPSTAGVAGLGCAGRTVPGSVSCNFLDDPVFLSKRGIEAVGKETVNLERTLTHRSSNVDRILIKEDLSRASLAEWKGYLVICTNGNFYLADSKVLSQHADGSYQYEWYYFEGLGTYDDYMGGYRYIKDWYSIDDSGTLLSECEVFVESAYYKLNEYCALGRDMSFDGTDSDILAVTAIRPDGSSFDFYVDTRYDTPLALEKVDEERTGAEGSTFYPATKIATVGERLFFGTDNGDICVINTDKRGVPDYEGQQIEHDRISARWYSFNGVAYPSICVTKLDDCSKKSLSKATVPGTTVARLKMMPGSRCRVEVSLNGRDFKKIGEAFASRYDAGDLRFDNFAFAENEDSLVVLRELTRNWVDKQYSFISEGFREPFGLYELSYLYYVKGKIRRI